VGAQAHALGGGGTSRGEEQACLEKGGAKGRGKGDRVLKRGFDRAASKKE